MKRTRLGWLIVMLGLVPVGSAAQTATPTSKIAWSEGAADPATAAGYVYTLYEGTAKTTLGGVVCVAGSVTGVQTCTAPLGAFPSGAHTISLTAGVSVTGVLYESGKTAAVTFTMVVIPGTPTNVVVIP